MTLELSLIHYGLLFFGSFIASLFGSLIGIGGGFIVLGILSFLFPLSVMIPLLAGVLACIDLSRTVAFHSNIYRPIFSPFLIGCVIGVLGGSFLFISLPETVIGTGLGILILLSLIQPDSRISWKFKYPFVWVGTIHSFLSTLFGYGGLLQAVMIRTKLTNLQITATLSTSFLALELLKVGSYAIGGFNYQPYIGVIIIAACGAIPASLIGRKFAHKISHKFYRVAQKIIIALIAINILVRIWS